MKQVNLTSLTDEQLVHSELQAEADLVRTRFLLYTNQLEDSSKVGRLRRQIARLQTEQRRRELERGQPRNSMRGVHRGSFRDQGATAPTTGSFVQSVLDR